MNSEEIKNLKKGDKFTVVFNVAKVQDEFIHVCYEDGTEYGAMYRDCSSSLRKATLVKPAPKFEEGDTVRVIPDPLIGYAYNDSYVLNRHIGRTGIVKVECDDHGQMQVDMGDAEENRYTIIDIHCLELVKKAVKDKYHIDMDSGEWYIMTASNAIVARYEKKYHPCAEAAAQAECDRLNAEWRAQQEGGEA